jgi:hypothetical protein
MSVFVSSTFWWGLSLIVGGLVIGGAVVSFLGITLVHVLAFCLIACGVLTVINVLGGARRGSTP